MTPPYRTPTIALAKIWDTRFRYSLIISMRAAEGAMLYNAIHAQIKPEIVIET